MKIPKRHFEINWPLPSSSCHSVFITLYNHCIPTNQGPLSCALDIGCGTGQSTENLLPHFEKVYGCDPSQAMLDQAAEDYKNHGKYFNRTHYEKKSTKSLCFGFNY